MAHDDDATQAKFLSLFLFKTLNIHYRRILYYSERFTHKKKQLNKQNDNIFLTPKECVNSAAEYGP